MRNTEFFFLFLFIISLCGCNFMNYPSEDSTAGIITDVRTVKGKILADGTVVSGQILASTASSTQNGINIAGVKVYCAYNPNIFAITDENGNFSITIDLAKYRRWKRRNRIPDIEEDEETPKVNNNRVALVAEKTIKKADGTEVVLSTTIPIDCGDKKTIDLNEVFDPTQNKSSWIKVNSTLNGICSSEDGPVQDLLVLFYENRYKNVVKQYKTDYQGKFTASLPSGNYRVVLIKEGFEPWSRPGILLKEGETTSIEFAFAGRKLSDSADTTVVKPIIAPKRFRAPLFETYVNGVMVAKKQVVNLLDGATMTLDVNVYDPDSGLGDLSGVIGEKQLFETVSVNRQIHLKRTFVSKLPVPGKYKVKLTAKDYDQISVVKPSEPGYYRVKIPKKGKAGFTNSIGVKIIDSSGKVKFNDIIIEDANKKVGKSVDIKVEAGDQVLPYVHVNTKNHRTNGIPNEYDLFIGDIDPFDDLPVSQTKIVDGKLQASFEDCRGKDRWCDWDYNDIYFMAWFTKEPVEGSSEIVVKAEPAHVVDFSFYVQVKPIIVTKGKIAGVVIDDNTENPVVGAVVGIAGTDINTFTDDNGYFELLNIKPGTYDIVATRDGYQGKTFPDIVVPE